jgi:hypothetical protein
MPLQHPQLIDLLKKAYSAEKAAIYDMGIKEKEHEVYFLEGIKTNRLLPLFEKLFSWGGQKRIR